ncbi:MAG: DUF2189 domain-containing protein [Chromatiaceae bacterium]|nr:MAG: DUF2189 domain-containing protein [Chromatiaceae bacterium]
MATETIRNDSTTAVPPTILRVTRTAPLDWLRAGWHTLRAHPVASLLYGTLFAAACQGVLALTNRVPWFTAAYLTGLLLIGPFLAAGLYVAARQHAAGERVSIRAALALLWQRRTNLSLFAVYLALVMAAWVRLSALLLALQVDAFGPTAHHFLGVLQGHWNPVVLIYFLSIGGLLALTVFVSSAVAIPLIVDRDSSPITAIQISYRAVTTNWQPMLLWAMLILALTLVGILTWFVGMILCFPLLGYATWHSYRALLA